MSDVLDTWLTIAVWYVLGAAFTLAFTCAKKLPPSHWPELFAIWPIFVGIRLWKYWQAYREQSAKIDRAFAERPRWRDRWQWMKEESARLREEDKRNRDRDDR